MAANGHFFKFKLLETLLLFRSLSDALMYASLHTLSALGCC